MATVPDSFDDFVLRTRRTLREASPPPRSLGVAGLLLAAGGGVGAHRFYLGLAGSALTMFVLFCGVLLLRGTLGAAVLAGLLCLWNAMDLAFLPDLARAAERRRLRGPAGL